MTAAEGRFPDTCSQLLFPQLRWRDGVAGKRRVQEMRGTGTVPTTQQRLFEAIGALLRTRRLFILAMIPFGHGAARAEWQRRWSQFLSYRYFRRQRRHRERSQCLFAGYQPGRTARLNTGGDWRVFGQDTLDHLNRVRAEYEHRLDVRRSDHDLVGDTLKRSAGPGGLHIRRAGCSGSRLTAQPVQLAIALSQPSLLAALAVWYQFCRTDASCGC